MATKRESSMAFTMREMLQCIKASRSTGCSLCIYESDCPYPTFDDDVEYWSKQIREENEHELNDILGAQA